MSSEERIKQFEEAQAALARGARGSSSDPLSMRRNLEQNYARAHALAFGKRKLRRKYRP